VIIEINSDFPDPRKVQRAVDVLAAGEVIAYPTDTLYALGCDMLARRALERIYQLKSMPRTHPLALICPDLSDIARYARVDDRTYRMLKRLLPGPYTCILEASREVPRILQSKRKTIGIRVPKNPLIVEVARALGRPVLSSSAVDQNGEPLRDAADLDARWPDLALILDGGWGGVTPTTVIDLVNGAVVREGAGPVGDLIG
jgi:tRNA threonylcarbamoyl adenosine modification protein (Sua5/YciO/YrdC/YwlC family)